MSNAIDFPVYRVRFDKKTFYKIISLEEFVEYQIIGSKVVEYQIKAQNYFDRLRIKDILEDGKVYFEVKESEFLLDLSKFEEQ